MESSLVISFLVILCTASSFVTGFEQIETEEAPHVGDLKLVVVTVATEKNDGYKRFMRSAEIYGYKVETYGMGEQWLGGDMEIGAGGGHKINILRKGLKKYAEDNTTLLMFTDSYDVILAAEPEEVILKFLSKKTRVLFSAEDFCWPDQSLANQYPPVKDGYKYLCSGGIIGYAPALWDLLNKATVANTDDDQLYYTNIYLKDREKLNLALDHQSVIFQNLNGNKPDLSLTPSKEGSGLRISNNRFNTLPAVIHGNGPSKKHLNHLGNYLAKSWTFEEGCLSCLENKYQSNDVEEKELPQVLIGLFIEAPTPFVSAFLHHISNQRYPKKNIDIFLHNAEPLHSRDVDEWLQKYEKEYKSVTYKNPRQFIREHEARNQAITLCGKLSCNYYLSVDATVTLNNYDALKLLIEQNRPFISPILSKPGKLWSNFWGDVANDGYYARSPDYIDIVKNNRKGMWNSPYVSSIFLMQSSVVEKLPSNPYGTHVADELDIKFCTLMRKLGIFMHATNTEHFGHLKETENYKTTQKHNDLYEIFDNRLDWEDQYLHPNFTEYLKADSVQHEVCTDVYWFPFVTTNYTEHMIEEVEHNGDWSGAKHEDKRISGGYENVPTDDIHMKQINFEKHWLQMLKDYIAPLATRNYPGYHSYSHAIMNFVVKYTMKGQYFLRPHHDASTFTINMALNADFTGGGARFIRYNCSVVGTDMRPGWGLIHPGRLTHYHEGLPITSGTRYIMVSFVDP